MKWFKHYSDAHNNNKLTKIRMKYGANGYAIYWYCLELISGELGTNENITFELKHDAEVIGYNLKVDSKLVEEIMRYMINLNLFQENGNVITCLKLAKYLDKKTTRNATILKIIDTAKSLTVQDSLPTVPDKSRQIPLDTDTDTDTDIKHKSKSTDLDDFEKFWKLYPRKESKKKSQTCWNKLNKTKRAKAIQDLKSRFQDTEPKFIPLATTYLNGERWDDEANHGETVSCGQGGI